MNETRDHDRHEWMDADGRRMATITCEWMDADGQRMATIVCPFCDTSTDAHLRSLAGSGKRCPGCRALHIFHPATPNPMSH